MTHRIREITKGWKPMLVITLVVFGGIVIITMAVFDVVRFVRSL